MLKRFETSGRRNSSSPSLQVDFKLLNSSLDRQNIHKSPRLSWRGVGRFEDPNKLPLITLVNRLHRVIFHAMDIDSGHADHHGGTPRDRRPGIIDGGIRGSRRINGPQKANGEDRQ